MVRSSRTSAVLCTAALTALLTLGTRLAEPDLFRADPVSPESSTRAASASTRDRVDSGDPRHAMRITAFARRYDIETQLSRQIYEAAQAERVSPALAFGLVLVESRFDPEAVGTHGAVGLTQIRTATAREMVPRVLASDLTAPALNLRLGFRYLHTLLDRFDQDVMLALAAYNSGPTRVEQQIARGQAPSTAYARKVLRNVEGGSSATL
jgi:soluble lytic murein transglycosylase-like protein